MSRNSFRNVEIIIRVGIGIIPGRIHIIISVIQLHDIPCMILAGMPFYIITGNPQLLHDILESPRVSCTYRSSIYQCTVCTLVHGCVLIIYNRIKNRIMHCCFLIIICIFSTIPKSRDSSPWHKGRKRVPLT